MRLESADGTLLGSLFFYDGRGTCNGGPDHYLFKLALEQDGRECSRNADIDEAVESSDGFEMRATNHGGVFGPICGDPTGEIIDLSFRRSACDSETFDVVTKSNQTGSPFALTAVAKRCACEVAFDPCTTPTPEDPCEAE